MNESDLLTFYYIDFSQQVTKGSHPASTASDQQFVGADESGPNGQIG